MNIGELVNKLTEWKDRDPKLMGRRVKVFLSSSDGAEERELDIESACIEDDPALIFVSLDREASRWAEPIAARIADEWAGKDDDPEEAALLETVLAEALGKILEARLMELVGTGIIEEDYFDELDVRGQKKGRGGNPSHHTPNRRKGGE